QLKHKAMNKLSDLILSEHLHTLVALTRVSIGAISHRIETESVRDLDATAEFATVSQWTETTRAAIVHALSIYATVGEWTLPRCTEDHPEDDTARGDTRDWEDNWKIRIPFCCSLRSSNV
ncbi:hypothetical protein PMAYCL1PPCAC_33499, partial [Pristionchus mayeri]